MEENITLGKYLKEHREKEDELSQRRLAKEIGLSHSTISRIENDQCLSPDNKTLKLIADRLNLDYKYLLVLNGTLEDEPDIRIFRSVVKRMTRKERKLMIHLLMENFGHIVSELGEDVIERFERELKAIKETAQ